MSASVPSKAIVTAVSSKVVTDCATADGASFTGAKVIVTKAPLAPLGEDRRPSETDTRNTTGPLALRTGS